MASPASNPPAAGVLLLKERNTSSNKPDGYETALTAAGFRCRFVAPLSFVFPEEAQRSLVHTLRRGPLLSGTLAFVATSPRGVDALVQALQKAASASDGWSPSRLRALWEGRLVFVIGESSAAHLRAHDDLANQCGFRAERCPSGTNAAELGRHLRARSTELFDAAEATRKQPAYDAAAARPDAFDHLSVLVGDHRREELFEVLRGQTAEAPRQVIPHTELIVYHTLVAEASSVEAAMEDGPAAIHAASPFLKQLLTHLLDLGSSSSSTPLFIVFFSPSGVDTFFSQLLLAPAPVAKQIAPFVSRFRFACIGQTSAAALAEQRRELPQLEWLRQTPAAVVAAKPNAEEMLRCLQAAVEGAPRSPSSSSIPASAASVLPPAVSSSLVSIPFFKYHGTLNDYVLLDGFERHYSPSQLAQIARELCSDRRGAIGSDGLLYVTAGRERLLTSSPSSLLDADPSKSHIHGRMYMFNTDGSEAEMCIGEDHEVLTDRGFLSLDEVKAMRPDLFRAGATASSVVPSLHVAPLLFASYDDESDTLVYVPAVRVFEKQVTEVCEFTQRKEAMRWASDADAFGRTTAQMDLQQAASASNDLSIVTDAGHTMFVQQGHMQKAPQTFYSSSPFARVLAGALVDDASEDRALRFKGLARAGVGADDLAELPFLSALGIESGDTACVDAFLELYGYWLGNGSLTSSPPWMLSFSCKSVDQPWLLQRLALMPGLQVRDVIGANVLVDTRSDQSLSINVCEPRWVAFFYSEYSAKDGLSTPAPSADEGIKSTKRMAHWTWSLRRERMRCLLAGLRMADVDGHEKQDLNRIYTSSARFRDEIVRAALHAGYSAHFALSLEGERPAEFNKQGASIVSKQNSWAVSYSDNSNGDEPILRACVDVVTRKQLDTRVWCPTVTSPSHLIVVRRVKRDQRGVVTMASMPVIVGNCGNGLRCVAKFVYDHKCTQPRPAALNLMTGAGEKTARMVADPTTGLAAQISLDLGRPVMELSLSSVQPLLVHDVSMGNPHSIVLLPDADPTGVLRASHLDQVDVDRWGKAIHDDARYTNTHGTNVSFVSIRPGGDCSNSSSSSSSSSAPSPPASPVSGAALSVSPLPPPVFTVDIRTYERGNGETWSCGSGISATVSSLLARRPRASVASAFVPVGGYAETVRVFVRGGELSVTCWMKDRPASPSDFVLRDVLRVQLTGPAAEVFEGKFPMQLQA